MITKLLINTDLFLYFLNAFLYTFIYSCFCLVLWDIIAHGLCTYYYSNGLSFAASVITLGTDSDDRLYTSIADLWSFELGVKSRKRGKKKDEEKSEKNDWYSTAEEYWNSEANCPLSGT